MIESRVYDHILKAQQCNSEKQTRLLASCKACRGKKLHLAGLAYVIEFGLAKKSSVTVLRERGLV